MRLDDDTLELTKYIANKLIMYTEVSDISEEDLSELAIDIKQLYSRLIHIWRFKGAKYGDIRE